MWTAKTVCRCGCPLMRLARALSRIPWHGVNHGQDSACSAHKFEPLGDTTGQRCRKALHSSAQPRFVTSVVPQLRTISMHPDQSRCLTGKPDVCRAPTRGAHDVVRAAACRAGAINVVCAQGAGLRRRWPPLGQLQRVQRRRLMLGRVCSDTHNTCATATEQPQFAAAMRLQVVSRAPHRA